MPLDRFDLHAINHNRFVPWALLNRRRPANRQNGLWMEDQGRDILPRVQLVPKGNALWLRFIKTLTIQDNYLWQL